MEPILKEAIEFSESPDKLKELIGKIIDNPEAPFLILGVDLDNKNEGRTFIHMRGDFMLLNKFVTGVATVDPKFGEGYAALLHFLTQHMEDAAKQKQN